jgi:hypothetical protein
MPLIGKSRSIQTKHYDSATLSALILTWNDPETNPGLRHESSVASRLSHGTVVMRTDINVVAF